MNASPLLLAVLGLVYLVSAEVYFEDKFVDGKLNCFKYKRNLIDVGNNSE